MPLSETRLKNAIIASITAEFGAPDDSDINEKFYRILAEKIVDEIRTNLRADISALLDGQGNNTSGTITFS